SRTLRPSLVAGIAAFALVGVLPSFAYTWSSFGRVGPNAAGGGIGEWYGYWQGVWSARTTDAILAAAYRAPPGTDLRAELASLEVDADAAALYASEFMRLGAVLEGSSTREGVARYLAADAEYRGLASAHRDADRGGWLARGFLYRAPVLWAGE